MSNELSKRAVACKGWRWMPGMMTEGWRLTCVSLHDGAWSATSTLAHREYHYPTLPDITDPATLGCLLALVRDALGHDCAVRRWDGGWVLVDAGRHNFTAKVCPTEAEALVAALETAEGREVSDE